MSFNRIASLYLPLPKVKMRGQTDGLEFRVNGGDWLSAAHAMPLGQNLEKANGNNKVAHYRDKLLGFEKQHVYEWAIRLSLHHHRCHRR